MYLDEERKVRPKGSLYKAIFPDLQVLQQAKELEQEVEEKLQQLKIQSFT